MSNILKAPMPISGCAWTGPSDGSSRFLGPTREKRTVLDTISAFGRINERLERSGVPGMKGLELHVPNEVDETSAKEIIARMKDNGLVLAMITPNIFYTFPVRGLSSEIDAERVRALDYAKRAIDLAYTFEKELGYLPRFIMWPGGEGYNRQFEIFQPDAVKRYAEAVNILMAYDKAQHGGRLFFAGEAKPQEPKGQIIIPTTGSFLAVRSYLDEPKRFGANPETAHEHMASIEPTQPVGEAIAQNGLFHYHANNQGVVPGTFDKDLEVRVDLVTLEVVQMLTTVFPQDFSGQLPISGYAPGIEKPGLFIGLDMQSRPEDASSTQVVEISIRNIRYMEEVIQDKVDWNLVRQMRSERDFVNLTHYVECAMQGRPFIRAEP